MKALSILTLLSAVASPMAKAAPVPKQVRHTAVPSVSEFCNSFSVPLHLDDFHKSPPYPPVTSSQFVLKEDLFGKQGDACLYPPLNEKSRVLQNFIAPQTSACYERAWLNSTYPNHRSVNMNETRLTQFLTDCDNAGGLAVQELNANPHSRQFNSSGNCVFDLSSTEPYHRLKDAICRPTPTVTSTPSVSKTQCRATRSYSPTFFNGNNYARTSSN